MRLELDWYNRITKDWLVDPPQPADFGVSPAFINGGDVQNTGFEITLGWNEQVSKDFYFDTNLSLSYNKNKVLKLQMRRRFFGAYQRIVGRIRRKLSF